MATVFKGSIEVEVEG